MYTNIPIIDPLNILKDYVNSKDQFTRKMAIPQDKVPDVIQPPGTLLILSFTNKLMVLSWEANDILNHSRNLYPGL